jgi:tetratricopeptide (TPR) repeat protein
MGPIQTADDVRASDQRMIEVFVAADQLLAHGNHRAALALCTQALADHGDRARLRLQRARALMALGCDDNAECDLALALRLAPRWAHPHRLLCEIALRRRDLDSAEVFLDRALRLDPTHPRTHELAHVILGWRAVRPARDHRRRTGRAA